MAGGDVEATIKVKGGEAMDSSKSQNDSKIYYSNKVVGGEAKATLKVTGGDVMVSSKSQKD